MNPKSNVCTPYFYIIQHKQSKIKYAGSRFSKRSRPDELLKKNGYCTSSSIIAEIIEKEGLDAFEIVEINTHCDGMHPVDYETKFLLGNNCAESDEWYNLHNNDFVKRRDEYFEKYLVLTYGDDYRGMSEKYKKRTTKKCLEKYGKEYYTQTNEYKIKSKKTLNKKYGVNNAFQLSKVTGDPHTCKYCGKVITSLGNFKRYHDEKCKLNPNRPKPEILRCEHCGYESTNQGSFATRHGYNCKHNPNKPKPEILTCIHCGFESTDIVNFVRWHGDNCKSNPNRIAKKLHKCEHCGYETESTSGFMKWHGGNCRSKK